MEHVYNGKENTKYLKLLKQNYSSSQAVIREIVKLQCKRHWTKHKHCLIH